MQLISLFLFAFVATSSYHVYAQEVEDGVLVLTKDNFDDAIQKHEMILVEFYAPWCGHCKALAPEYAKAAQELENDNSPIKLGKVDATVHSELAAKYEVQGYPTLKFIRNGNALEYTGPRDSAGIVSWLKRKSGPPLTVIESDAGIEKFTTEPRISLVYFGKEGTDAYKSVHAVATVLDHPMGHVAKDSEPKLVLYRKFDEPELTFSGDWKEEAIKSWVKANKIALVTEFGDEASQGVFESDIKTHLLAFLPKNEPTYKERVELLTKAAKEMRGKMHIVVIDMDKDESERIGEFFGLKKADCPTYRVVNLVERDMVKYMPESKDFTVSALVDFSKRVLAGEVKPHRKSQAEAADWDAKPVKVLVAEAFKKRAVTADKAVFVEFYAPWCGHCKQLAPIWDELGEAFADDSSVMIAKCDATENELEDIQISSFPTLKFSAKGSTEFVDYSGARTKEALVQFVKSNGKEVKEEEPKEDDKESHDEL